LPATGFESLFSELKSQFPLLKELIEIAILEENPEQVLYWYDQFSKRKDRIAWHYQDEVAEAVKAFVPERVVEIWKNFAESLIAEVKPRAYEEAITLLRKYRSVAEQLGKLSEWSQYISKLRVEHKPKRRLIEYLDQMEGKTVLNKR